MLISISPKYAVSQVVGFIKGKSAIHLARVYGERKRNFVGQHFWARGYWRRVTATLPFAVAGTILAIGLVLAYTARKLPFTVRTSSAILHQIDPSLEEASISLGVSPLRTVLGLVIPLMLGGIVSGMVLTWVTVASELSSTLVLYSGPWRTLTIVMFQALEGTGAGVAVAAASVLIASPWSRLGGVPIATAL
jgi:ABC-type Fe3+ transport system permease subunit